MEAPWRVSGAPGHVPLLGHALQLWRRPLEFLASLPAEGDLVELRLGPRRAFLACHPELVREVLMAPRVYDRGGLFDKARELLGNSLSTTRWEEHRYQRRLIQPSFRPDRITSYTTAVGEDTRAAIDTWRSGLILDLGDTMHALLMRVAARTLFSTGLDERTVDEAREYLRVASRGIYKRTVAPLGIMERLPTPGNSRYHRSIAGLRRIVAGLVAERRDSGEEHGDLLSTLLRARDEETGRGLDDQEVHDQVITFLVAGSETTASALTFTFHLVGTHPEVEERLHAELDRVLGGRPPVAGDLPKLEYTRRVVIESLRIYPPSWMSTRISAVETELAGRRVPEGSFVMFSPYALHHDPRLFPDPGRFDPDRWLPERAGTIPRGAMLPFGAGSHKCIGDVLALTETVLVVAAIASRWRLRPVPGTVLRPRPRATLEPGRLPMTCVAR